MSEDQGSRDAPPRDEGKADPPPGPAPGLREGVPRDGGLRDGGDGGSGDAELQEMTDEREESLDYDDGSSRSLRFDFEQAKVRDLAGHDINYHFHDSGSPRRTPGRIGVADLARAERVHVTARSDGQLEQSLREDQVVFVRGGIGTGRRASAVVVLDRLTGMSRRESKVTILETTSGLAELPDRLEPGRGHLLDASEANWVTRSPTCRSRRPGGRCATPASWSSWWSRTAPGRCRAPWWTTCSPTWPRCWSPSWPTG